MATEIDNYSPYGMACSECNELLLAPKWSRTSANTQSVISGLVKIAVTTSR
jgi:hypothetical protein